MIEKLKKQWFVCLIALIFVGIICYAVVSTNVGKLPGKSAKGKDVVASLESTNIYADDLYDEMLKTGGQNIVQMQFQIAVVENAVKTTSDMKSKASEMEKSIIANTKNSSTQNQEGSNAAPTDYKEQIAGNLKSMGFGGDDLLRYCIYSLKSDKMSDDYIKAHYEEVFTPIYTEKKSRLVSHILVKMADSENPTEKELEKVAAVESALASGKAFGDVAKSMSDDTASKEKKGFLGYFDSDNTVQFVESFKNAALELGDKQTSAWVKEKNESYNGWHLILADTTDIKTIMASKDKAVFASVKESILKNNTSLQEKIIWSYTKDLDIKFNDKKTKEQIYSTFNVSEDTAKK